MGEGMNGIHLARRLFGRRNKERKHSERLASEVHRLLREVQRLSIRRRELEEANEHLKVVRERALKTNEELSRKIDEMSSRIATLESDNMNYVKNWLESLTQKPKRSCLICRLMSRFTRPLRRAVKVDSSTHPSEWETTWLPRDSDEMPEGWRWF